MHSAVGTGTRDYEVRYNSVKPYPGEDELHTLSSPALLLLNTVGHASEDF